MRSLIGLLTVSAAVLLMCGASIGQEQAEPLFAEDFTGYDYIEERALLHAESADWDITSTIHTATVGQDWGDSARVQNNHWAWEDYEFLIATNEALAGRANYSISATMAVPKDGDGQPYFTSRKYIGGRVLAGDNTASQYVLVGATVSSSDNNLYALLIDSAGKNEQVYVAGYVPDALIGLELTLFGENVQATVSYAGYSHTFETTTRVVDAGWCGFGTQNRWNFARADIHDFEIRQYGPAYCGDVGTVYLEADINLDCVVDILDFALLAENWLYRQEF